MRKLRVTIAKGKTESLISLYSKESDPEKYWRERSCWAFLSIHCVTAHGCIAGKQQSLGAFL